MILKSELSGVAKMGGTAEDNLSSLGREIIYLYGGVWICMKN
ncbi:MAG: hypothetical protein R6U91_03550 [Bacillota bacterium]